MNSIETGLSHAMGKGVDGTLIYQAQAGAMFSDHPVDVGTSIFYGGTVVIGDTTEFWEHLWQQVTRIYP